MRLRPGDVADAEYRGEEPGEEERDPAALVGKGERQDVDAEVTAAAAAARNRGV